MYNMVNVKEQILIYIEKSPLSQFQIRKKINNESSTDFHTNKDGKGFVSRQNIYKHLHELTAQFKIAFCRKAEKFWDTRNLVKFGYAESPEDNLSWNWPEKVKDVYLITPNSTKLFQDLVKYSKGNYLDLVNETIEIYRGVEVSSKFQEALLFNKSFIKISLRGRATKTDDEIEEFINNAKKDLENSKCKVTLTFPFGRFDMNSDERQELLKYYSVHMSKCLSDMTKSMQWVAFRDEISIKRIGLPLCEKLTELFILNNPHLESKRKMV